MSSNSNWAARDEADKTAAIDFALVNPAVDAVHARPIASFPGRAVIDLAGSRINVQVRGDIANLRAWAVEIDRQLALLEVEHRVDEAVATDAVAEPEASGAHQTGVEG